MRSGCFASGVAASASSAEEHERARAGEDGISGRDVGRREACAPPRSQVAVAEAHVRVRPCLNGGMDYSAAGVARCRVAQLGRQSIFSLVRLFGR
jgi:hypothetical protein